MQKRSVAGNVCNKNILKIFFASMPNTTFNSNRPASIAFSAVTKRFLRLCYSLVHVSIYVSWRNLSLFCSFLWGGPLPRLDTKCVFIGSAIMSPRILKLLPTSMCTLLTTASGVHTLSCRSRPSIWRVPTISNIKGKNFCARGNND